MRRLSVFCEGGESKVSWSRVVGTVVLACLLLAYGISFVRGGARSVPGLDATWCSLILGLYGVNRIAAAIGKRWGV